jgi:hypothetical protein
MFFVTKKKCIENFLSTVLTIKKLIHNNNLFLYVHSNIRGVNGHLKKAVLPRHFSQSLLIFSSIKQTLYRDASKAKKKKSKAVPLHATQGLGGEEI